MHDSAILLGEHGGKISPLVEHAHDFDAPIDHAIEERVRMNQYGSQSWHDLIARAPHQRLFGKTLTRPVEFAQETVCDFC
jgi:hypothetical protein